MHGNNRNAQKKGPTACESPAKHECKAKNEAFLQQKKEKQANNEKRGTNRRRRKSMNVKELIHLARMNEQRGDFESADKLMKQAINGWMDGYQQNAHPSDNAFEQRWRNEGMERCCNLLGKSGTLLST